MTKVQELRRRVLNVCFDTSAIDDIAELISAAKTEGEEQERERIRKWLYEPDPANPGYHIHINILGELEFITPFDLLSILDPKDDK